MPRTSAGMLRWPPAADFVTMSPRETRTAKPIKFTRDFRPFVFSRAAFSPIRATTKAMKKATGVLKRLENVELFFYPWRRRCAASLRLLLLLCCVLAACGVTSAQQYGADNYSGMRWRLVGP